MKKELIVIDFDKTLNNEGDELHLDCYHQAVVGVGINLPPEEERRRIDSKWGARDDVVIGELLADIKESPQKIHQASALYKNYLRRNYLERVTPVDESVPLLGRLATSGYSLALATATEPNVLREALRKFEIPDGTFKEIVTAYDIEPWMAKPDPHQIELIMRRLNKLPDQTVMVGDSENDVLMALYAGVEPIVVTTGRLDRKRAEELGVDERNIIPNITSLEEVLGRLSLRTARAA